MASAAVVAHSSIDNLIRSHSTTFNRFEIIEGLFIVFASLVQTKLIANLLKSDIVV